MRTQTQKKPQRVRVLRAKRLPRKTYVEECRALQESIGRDRNWELMPDSTEVIRAMRDGELR
jgi:hypothetical protein